MLNQNPDFMNTIQNPYPRLFTQKIWQKLVSNGEQQRAVKGTEEEIDFVPVVKLFIPGTMATWFLSEIDPDCPELAFGLCDLGEPELGYVSLEELNTIQAGAFRLRVERDRSFSTDKTLTAFYEAYRS